MLIYFVLYIMSAATALVEFFKKISSRIVFFIILFAGVISGSRDVSLGGYDTGVYKMMYDSTDASLSAVNQNDFLLNTTEKGFILIIALSKIIGLNFNLFLLLVGVICAILLWKSFDYLSTSVMLWFTVFLSKGYLFYFFVTQRQIIAMCICWFALRYVKKRKLLYFLIYCITASFFHTSAIVFCLAYFFSSIKLSNKVSIFLMIFAIIFGVLGFGAALGNLISPYLPGFASEKLNGYISGSAQSINILNFFEMVPVFLFVLIYRERMDRSIKNFSILFNLFIIFLLITFAFYDFNFIARIKGYFLIGYIGILAGIPYSFRDKKVGLAPLMLLLLYCAAVMIRELLTFDLGKGYMPYKSFLMDYI